MQPLSPPPVGTGSIWNRILPHAANIFAWGVLIGLIYTLSSFFSLIFLTFVFAYLQTSLGAKLKPFLPSRITRVILVALAFIGVLTAAGVFLAPKVKAQMQIFISQYSLYVNAVDRELFRLADKYRAVEEIMAEMVDSQLEEPDDADEALALAEKKPAESSPANERQTEGEAPVKKQARRIWYGSPSTLLIQQFLGLGNVGGAHNINQLIDTVGNIGGKIFACTTTFLLSLLFSFLIVLDLPALRRHVHNLEHTRLRFIYHAVAGNIREFSQVLGRALEAQLVIATANSLLTALGICLLGLKSNAAFLSVIVFFCSFFPVVGVFISSIPICLVALQLKGPHTMILAVGLIIMIHLIEGYILNPRVYGSYMRINAVITLMILTLAGKLFGVWGLLLGVPVCTYIFGYAIQLKKTELRLPPARVRDASSATAEEVPVAPENAPPPASPEA